MKGLNAANVHTPYQVAEEHIPNDQPFVKYIHNSDPNPLPEEDEPGYDLVQFLAFTQHIQYVKTGATTDCTCDQEAKLSLQTHKF